MPRERFRRGEIRLQFLFFFLLAFFSVRPTTKVTNRNLLLGSFYELKKKTPAFDSSAKVGLTCDRQIRLQIQLPKMTCWLSTGEGLYPSSLVAGIRACRPLSQSRARKPPTPVVEQVNTMPRFLDLLSNRRQGESPPNLEANQHGQFDRRYGPNLWSSLGT